MPQCRGASNRRMLRYPFASAPVLAGGQHRGLQALEQGALEGPAGQLAARGRQAGGQGASWTRAMLCVRPGIVQHSPGLRSCNNMVLKPQGDRSAAAAPVHHGISQQRLQPRGGCQRGQQDFDAAAAAALVALAQQLASTLHTEWANGAQAAPFSTIQDRQSRRSALQGGGQLVWQRHGTAGQPACSHVSNTTSPAHLAVIQGVGEQLDDLAVHSVRSVAARGSNTQAGGQSALKGIRRARWSAGHAAEGCK